MGQFTVQMTVAHPADPSRSAQVDLFVDTGATLSWLPKELLERLEVPRVGRRTFLIADGRKIERETGGVVLRYDGTQANVTVVFAEQGDSYLLGATSLETLGFGVDPINLRLIPQTLLAL